MSPPNIPRKTNAWLLAARPKTLPASIVPVGLGIAISYSALASETNDIPILRSFAILICAMLIQITTNFANDLFDFRKGADNADRRGPMRAVQAGLISEQKMHAACLICVFLCLILGSYLVKVGGLPILLIGVSSILFAFLYTAGPYPIAYLGLGEVFVFIFFGPIAVWGTVYLLTLQSSAIACVLGASLGLFSSAILAANNLRDIETDTRANKNTLAVRFGKTFAKAEYTMLVVIPSLFPVLMYFHYSEPLFLLPALCLIPSLFLSLRAYSDESSAFQIRLLENTGKLLVAYGILLSVALLLH